MTIAHGGLDSSRRLNRPRRKGTGVSLTSSRAVLAPRAAAGVGLGEAFIASPAEGRSGTTVARKGFLEAVAHGLGSTREAEAGRGAEMRRMPVCSYDEDCKNALIGSKSGVKHCGGHLGIGGSGASHSGFNRQ